MADPKLRLAALTVLGGALHGRRHDPDEVVTEILIGSDPDCHLVVDLPGISPIHARVWADLDESLVHIRSSGSPRVRRARASRRTPITPQTAIRTRVERNGPMGVSCHEE